MLGTGGMGVVYLAAHEQTGDYVALKLVRGTVRARINSLRQEIRVLATLSHPGVVKIVAHGLCDGMPWYAMEVLSGRSLRDMIRSADAWRHMSSHASTISDSVRLIGAGRDPALFTGSSAPSAFQPTVEDAACRSGYSAVSVSGAVDPHGPTATLVEGVTVAADEELASQQRERRSLPPMGEPRWPRAVLPLSRVLAIGAAICRALHYVHDSGLVHRDIKPANIIIGADDAPVLVDFGLATFSSRAGTRETLDLRRREAGTLAYMAPECFGGATTTRAVDLYAIGCVLFELVCGSPPFVGTPHAIAEGHLRWPVPDVAEWAPNVPAPIAGVIARLLAKSPADRPASAGEVADILDGGSSDSGVAVAATHGLRHSGFFGRQREVAVIMADMEASAAGSLNVIMVRGDSGSGKTRLAVDVAQRARASSFRVVCCDCPPVGLDTTSGDRFAPRALRPLDALATELRLARDENGRPVLTSEDDALIQGVIVNPSEPAASLEERNLDMRDGMACIATLHAALTKVAAQAPWLLIIDDLQWADELTLRFVEGLAETRGPLRDAKLVVLCLCRTSEQPHGVATMARSPSVRAVTLAPLEDRAVEEIISEILGDGASSPAFVQSVSRLADGNPLHVGEVVRAAQLEAESGNISEVLLRLPASLDGLIVHRLETLGRDAMGVLGAAAVFGRSCSEALLASALRRPPEEIATAVAGAQRLGLIEPLPDRNFHFIHDKTREVAYRQLGESQRSDLHREAALALESVTGGPLSGGEQAKLAMHWERAQTPNKALTYLESAGGIALSAGAYRDAVALLEHALTLSGQTMRPRQRDAADRARWSRMLGVAWLGLGKLRRATASVHAAASELGHAVPSSSVGWAGRLVLESARQAWHLLRPPAPVNDGLGRRDAALAMDYASECCYFSNQLVQTLTHTVQAVNQLDRCAPDERVGTPYSRVGYTATVLRLHTIAERYFRRGETYSRTAQSSWDIVHSACLEGTALIGVGRLRAALDLGRGALAVSARERNAHLRELGWTITGWSQFFMGDLAGAHESFQQLRESGTARLNEQHAAWGACGVASVFVRRRDPVGARDVLDEAERLNRNSADHGTEIVKVGHLLSLALVEGHTAESAALVADLNRLRVGVGATMFAELQSHVCHATAVWVLGVGSGSTAKAMRGMRRRSLWRLRVFSMLFPIARPSFLIHLGVAQLVGGRQARALRTWTDARERALELGMPHEADHAGRLAKLAGSDASAGTLTADVFDELVAQLSRA